MKDTQEVEFEIDDRDICEYVMENFEPDEVFEDTVLSDWAFENGFIRGEPDERGV